MEDTATRLTAGLAPARNHKVDIPTSEMILITGTTGSLGSNLLALMLAQQDVHRVYAFNRGEQAKLFERQQQALSSRGHIHVNLKKEIKIGRLVLLTGDLTKINWDLEEAEFEQVSAIQLLDISQTLIYYSDVRSNKVSH
jgi:nucleoside-diphosphate-sugar epimerase